MANVPIQKVEANKPALTPLLEGMKATFDRIRDRAFELFEHRGGAPGFDLDDWVRAEHELFWVPQAELTETDKEYKVRVGVPGFDARDLDVTVQSHEILIQGRMERRGENVEQGVTFSEFGAKSLYRRFLLDTTIDMGAVSANVENGMLTITASKAKETTTKMASAAA